MIESLHIAGFKLFRDLTLPKLGPMNLFVGENNTGKSCLLEAIGIYAGRSPIADILQTAVLRSQEPIRRWEKSGWNEEGTSLRHPVFDLFHWEGPTAGLPVQPILIDGIGDRAPLRIEVNSIEILSEEDGSYKYSLAGLRDELAGPFELGLPVYRADRQAALITRMRFPLYRSEVDLRRRLSLESRLLGTYLPANGFSDEMAASLWDELIQGPGQERVLGWLRMIDPRIQNLDYIAGRLNARIALLKVENKGRIPLRSMGDGLSRMFHIGLAMATASNGILLIDEFENGLHWRVQRELWIALAKAAQEFDVQIFATTHSRDCIGGFVSASEELGIEDAKLYRLERKDDEILAVDLALINVEAALRVNGEVR